MRDSHAVIKHQLHSIKVVIRHHFANRHVYGNTPAKDWITHYRRVRASSGFFDSIGLGA